MTAEDARTPDRRLATVSCEVCGAEVTRVNISRHNRSGAHQRALSRYSTVLSSDEEFTRFLRTIKGNHLRGFERRLFRYYRSQEES